SKLIGVSFQQIQKYENGNSGLSLQTFLKLCLILCVHPDYFFENFAFREDSFGQIEENLEQELLKIFRSVQNEKTKKRIINLIETLVSDFDE
ncbi:MAG: helix-turn-helix domain-containing protein, partial [Holosporales bacterium]|nr:helix-turn-helix domain-containing protein [Holosporales bacterium]